MKQVKIVVKKEFRDKHTGVTHKVGKKLTVTDARYREINRAGDYVSIEADTTPVAKQPEKATNEIKK